MPQFAGAPSLAGNFSYDPFAPARRQQPQQVAVAAPRRDGFSEDGLSYSVINDFDKLAAQALAEYEARVKNPRNDIWGQIIPEDRPENLKAAILDPISSLINGGARQESTPLRTYKTPGGGVVGVNPMTGESDMLVPDVPKDVPMSFGEREKIRSLYRDRSAIENMPIEDQTDDQTERLKKINEAIAAIESPPKPATVAAPVAPPLGANWPLQGSFIGTPGGTNSFSGTQAPFVAPQSQKRVLKFNRATGRLE